MSSAKKFDIVVYGATGFTGRLVAEYFVKQYAGDDSFSWAIAGRSEKKLAQVRDEIGAPVTTPLIVADASDLHSIQAMLDATKLVITTVGPYQLYGSELVAMCAQSGVDYVDLCGEPVWMRQMIDANEVAAKKSGARIVFSCGFDSIPFDLGIYRLQQLAKEQLGGTFSRVKGRVRKMQGTFSGGTAASLKATLAAAKQDPSLMQLLLNPFSLTPGFTGPAQPFGNKPYFEEDINTWVAPFVMAAINTRNVHRSNALLGHQYGENFIYDEMLMTGPGDKGEAIANAVANDKGMMKEGGPKPGEGPSKAEREAGFYDLLFVGINESGESLRVSVSAELDPGYGSTSRMIGESALCLLKDATDTQGGIWTTAPAMGEKLIKRLTDNAGLTFKQE